MSQDLAAVILAAGKGTRMKSSRAKVLHEIAGRAMLHYPLQAARQAGFERLHVVVGHQADLVRESLGEDGVSFIEQSEQLGTGHALLCAAESLADFSGTLLLLCGDVPLLREETLRLLLATHRQEKAAVTVLTAELENPAGYGRIIRDGETVLRIVEEKDATPEEKLVAEINTGTYLFDARFVFSALQGLGRDNAQGEYYLTDVVEAAVSAGLPTRAVTLEDPDEAMGINDLAQLAEAAELMRQRINRALMLAGVTMLDPATTYIDAGVEIAPGTLLHPNVMLRGRSSIGAGCVVEMGVMVDDSQIAAGVHLKAGSVVEGSIIGSDCKIGPMAHLRPGTELAGDNKLGNFVETKKAVFGVGSQASHLTYIGDAEVGERVNFGCGTITCNYDGVNKYRTTIEDDVFVGSDTQFIAPVRIGRNSLIAAGSTITKDVPADSLALSRTEQKVIEGWRLRKQKKNKK
ncbi:MAG: bifunctional UDP-N-acetylglucosamine diphosphorylase/glucosamine-1-phosphate N-acetyltransferase GlmU [Desulfuromonadales bacterium]|nr:bifunctional UDP-N-acetylglucosamine diphosphorylase/glucosamine-1-phosphate N-acetyltransferase GlmU [Desulfuromonadales bacterium]